MCDELENANFDQHEIFALVEEYTDNPIKLKHIRFKYHPYVFHSLISHIMRAEDKKYVEGHHRGRFMVLDAYNALADGMTIDEFKRDFLKKRRIS